MRRAIVRNVALFGGLGLSGAICAAAVPFLTSPRGANGPAIFTAASPFLALLAVTICFLLAAMICGIVGRFTNAAVAMFVLGAGVFVLAGRMANVREIAMLAEGGGAGSLALLAVETAYWAILVLIGSWIVFRISGLLPDIKPVEFGQAPHPIMSNEALKSAAAGAIMLPLIAVIAKSNMTGQMLGATFLGGVAAGLLGRLISPNVQPKLLFASPILFGAVGHLIAIIFLRSPLDAAYVTNNLPALSRPMPIDYAAGSLMGVAIGIGWARSFLHHEEEPAAAAAV